MNVITAPEPFPLLGGQPIVFLAGGITNCPNWQQEIINRLAGVTTGTLLNPRRPNFPINDPDAARAQITWEFNALARANIFSMWFCAGTSDQPICMYELGRHLALYNAGHQLHRVVIGIEPGYKREADVRIQTGLVNADLALQINTSLAEHAYRILTAIVR